MKETVLHRTTCRLCDEPKLELALPLEPTPVADDYVTKESLDKQQDVVSLDLYMCTHCGHVQLIDVIHPDILFGDYVYVTQVSKSLVEYFKHYAKDVLEKYTPPKEALVVDIGSNDGTFLKFFKDAGLRVFGIEPASRIATLAMESGVETHSAYFTPRLALELKEKHGPATIVTANNVFAHADNLGGILDGIRNLLKPEGFFIFEVSYLVDIVQKMLFDTVYHEHLCYHSVKSFKAFFQRHGMELVDVERIPSKGGSLHGTAQIKGPHNKISSSVEELIALEDSLKLDQLETFKVFSDGINRLKSQLLELLNDLKSQGKTIVGYGASATVTTLIYQFGLGELLSYLVDDNPRKFNTYSPGYHIPVFSSDVLHEKKPDYVVILAWNYSDPIINRHQKLINEGGHFIIPVPSIKIV
jgi:SAM-dependent methyltransferase